METQTFLDNFGAIAEAPGGSERLRKLVLALAVRGDLLDHDPQDEPVTTQWSPQRLKLKPEKLWESPTLPGTPPHGWATMPLARVGSWGSGGTPTKSRSDYYGGDIPWLVIGDLNNAVVESAEASITPKGLAESSAKMIPAGAVLVAMYGSIGKAGITGIECASNQAIAHCVPDPRVITTDYLFQLVRSLEPTFLSLGKGAAQQNISQTILKHLVVPVPPLAEQERIVTKVGELLQLCDELESRQRTRDTIVGRARASVLNGLTTAQDASEHQAAWMRVDDNFGDLIDTPKSVDELSSALLDLAVRGRLVPQDPTHTPAVELLARADTERHRLAANGSIGKPHARASIEPGATPFALPIRWCWAHLEDVCTHIVDCLHKTPKYSEAGYPAIRTSDVQPGKVLVEQARRVTAATFAERTSRLRPQEGDVLYSREGGRYGIAALVPPNVELCLAQRMMQFRCAAGINPNYLSWFLNSPFGFAQATADVGGSASPHVNIRSIRRFLMPIPPQPEQDLIVEKVGLLQGLCRELESSLRRRETIGAAWAAASTHSLAA